MRNMLFVTTAVTLLSLPGLASAQQPQPNQGQQAQHQQQSQQGEGADIKVQQKPAQITVQQPPPQVTVTQPAPQVKVEQPKPEVTVNQSKPDVTVQQAKPQVTVNQPGKADVNVEKGGTAQNNKPAAAQQAMTGDQAQQLIGKDVVSAKGQDMGDIENLIVDGKGKVKGVVVQWGGFLGIGDKERVVPWNQVNYDHANNRAVVTMTKDQIKALPEYDGPQSVADMGAGARPLR